MKKIATIISYFIFAVVISGCSGVGSNLFSSDQQAVGKYRVASFMNQTSGRIGVEIRDSSGKPYRLEDVERIKAEVIEPNGEVTTVMLTAEDLQMLDEELVNYRASRYSRKFDWVKEAHSASFRVWVPLPDGGTHELAFTCKAEKGISSNEITQTGVEKKRPHHSHLGGRRS